MNTVILVTRAITSLGTIIVCTIALVDLTSILAAGDEVFATYDLASRGENVTDKNQCYGEYDSATQTGWGPAYQYACIHSDSTEHSGGNTSWYNYTLATAGTIIDENTTSSEPATNTTTATESICPKGWTLPTNTQIRTIGPNSPGSSTYVSSFFPVLGGHYGNGTLRNEDTRGYWWGSTASNGARRYFLYYDGSSLSTSSGSRHYGRYVRCIQAS